MAKICGVLANQHTDAQRAHRVPLHAVLSQLSDPAEWLDPDDVPRPVVTVGATGFDMKMLDEKAAALYRERKEMGAHHHRKGELLLAMHGVLTCEVEGSLWIVPPQSAIWVPGGIVHKFVAAGRLECYVAFIDPSVASNLPSTCCALSATPLLRELLIRSASLPTMYVDGGIESHLVTLLLDEIAAAPIGNLHLPMPTDTRLRRIVEMITANPADRSTIETWARRVGMSERTLARALTSQTGMSFGRWRQQLHLMLAVQWLGAGASVQQVADDLGYESASSFVSMFRKKLGSPPARYMSERA